TARRCCAGVRTRRRASARWSSSSRRRGRAASPNGSGRADMAASTQPKSAAADSGARRSAAKPEKDAVEIAGVRVTSPDKVLYPEQGITKRELADYYEAVAGFMLPHIRNRPITLVRCPAGRQKKCF